MIFKQDLFNATFCWKKHWIVSTNLQKSSRGPSISWWAMFSSTTTRKRNGDSKKPLLASTANHFSVMSNVMKANSEPDVQKRVVLANNRPVVVVVKQPEEETVAHLARSANLIAMSHSHVKSEEDVAILVEEEM